MKDSTEPPSRWGLALAVLAFIACCASPLLVTGIGSLGIPLLIASHQTIVAVLAGIALAAFAILLQARLTGRSAVGTAASAFALASSLAARARSLAVLSLVGIPLTIFYLVALPAERYGAFSFGALAFLNAGDVLAAVVLGIGVGGTIALNMASQRRQAGQAPLTASGVLAALLPSSLCCTSLIPSVLAAAGASAPEVLQVTGRFQAFFAVYAASFIGFAVFAVAASLWLAAFNLTGSCAIPAAVRKEIL